MVMVGFPDIGKHIFAATNHVSSIWAKCGFDLAAAVHQTSVNIE